MTRIIDERGLRSPGVRHVGHVDSHRAAVAGEETIRGYLGRSYRLGAELGARSPDEPGAPPGEGASRDA